MFNWILDKIAWDQNQRQINNMSPIVNEINHLYAEYDSLSDDQIREKTEEFKQRYSKGESLDDMLPEAFATVKQACKRLVGQELDVKWNKQVWNMIPYDVQLIGGINLHKGQISEMKTWEGKTLVAAMPVYLNALTWKWVHVVTVNDYLASRDAAWIGYLYEFLWLSVGCVTKSTPVQGRREQYEKDITYMENSELGFDYLRDNLVKSIKDRVLLRRPLNYAIVDEIDSILVDEARTPLIISEPADEPTEKYQYYGKIVKTLIPCKGKKKVSKGFLHELLNETKKEEITEVDDWDYYIDEKTKTASLSSLWIAKLEKMLNVENLYRDIGYEEIHHIENALRAQAVYHKDKEYIIRDNEILIVDENTGRAMPGRRFSEGLHQAIEAKEGVEIRRESKTMATVTYQNFFKQYNKLSGMTGTALTEAEEFEKIYELSVLSIPTNKPIIRVDKNDKVFFNQKAKWKAVADHLEFANEIGQPILVGTSNIQTSEHVSNMLEKRSINHYVLNAKFHEQEANIVSQAGKYKSVVVATNMAWRGTDIKLDAWLNEKLADNYSKWIGKITKKGNSVGAYIYSESEYDLTIEGLKRVFDVSDDVVRSAEKDWTTLNDDLQFKVKFNSGRKDNTDPYAQLLVRPNQEWDMIEQNFHYGLFILGTEKHESRRIDNQLRGRAGRQWDAGVSVFFVALDDLIMRKMGGERVQAMAGMFLSAQDLETMELSQKQFTSSIIRAQKQVEAWHFSTRKHLFDYDTVIDKQRHRIYSRRDNILMSEEDEDKKQAYLSQKKEDIKNDITDIIDTQIQEAKLLNKAKDDFLENIIKELSIKTEAKDIKKFEKMDYDTLNTELTNFVIKNIETWFSTLDDERLYNIFKDVYLHYIDRLWVKHIDEMQYLRDKVGLMGYAQMDPLVVYKKEAFEKFQNLLYRIKFDTAAYIASIDFSGVKQQEELQQKLLTAKNKSEGEYLNMLQEVAKSEGFKKMMNDRQENYSKLFQEDKVYDAKKVAFQDEDGVEVFEVEDDQVNKPVVDTNTKSKVRPNDPCPCGSGKKYKKCCWSK